MKTFVVRVWEPAAPDQQEADAALHGLVELVGTERAQPFSGAESLLALLRTESGCGKRDCSRAAAEPGNRLQGKQESG